MMATRVTLHPWRVEAFRKAWEAGAGDHEVAALLQVSHHTASAIRQRLGLPPVRRRRNAEQPGAKHRGCLMCGQSFLSRGIGNRICGGCKQTGAWQSGAF